MNDNILFELINEAHDAALLKRILADRLNSYGGIKHDELELICTMFGIRREVEEK
jgi:hypothetical protein